MKRFDTLALSSPKQAVVAVNQGIAWFLRSAILRAIDKERQVSNRLLRPKYQTGFVKVHQLMNNSLQTLSSAVRFLNGRAQNVPRFGDWLTGRVFDGRNRNLILGLWPEKRWAKINILRRRYLSLNATEHKNCNTDRRQKTTVHTNVRAQTFLSYRHRKFPDNSQFHKKIETNLDPARKTSSFWLGWEIR
jgi:hypothetical protein